MFANIQNQLSNFVAPTLISFMPIFHQNHTWKSSNLTKRWQMTTTHPVNPSAPLTCGHGGTKITPCLHVYNYKWYVSITASTLMLDCRSFWLPSRDSCELVFVSQFSSVLGWRAFDSRNWYNCPFKYPNTHRICQWHVTNQLLSVKCFKHDIWSKFLKNLIWYNMHKFKTRCHFTRNTSWFAEVSSSSSCDARSNATLSLSRTYHKKSSKTRNLQKFSASITTNWTKSKKYKHRTSLHKLHVTSVRILYRQINIL